MGTRSFFVAAAVAINLLFLATVAIGATPPYKCFPFSKASNAKSSNDKSGTSQLTTEEIKCPGPDCAAIEPRGDFNLEVNQTYEAYCLFDSRHINVDDVVFKPIFSDDHEFFEHEVVNSSAIKISVTPQKAEKYDLRCLVNEQHLCSRTVSIGYPPQDVENFSCISKNWSDLNCTWTVPYNPVQVQYYVTYVIHGFRKQSECPRNHAHQSGCYWPSEIFNHVVKYEWSVLINSTNKLEPKGVVYRHNFNSQETVLPNPVENLEAHVDGPNNVTLTWTLPHPMRTFSLILCEASYRERHDGDLPEDVPWKVVDRWKVQPNRWASKEDFNRTISNLHAFVQYDFRVRIHTGYGAVRPHMWSDAATLTKRTSASYPAVAPKTTLGTFQIEEMRSHLEMYVYWQKLDPFYYNGPDFHYEINAFNAKNNSWLLKKNFRKEYAYAKFPDMDKDISYRFEIIPVNGEGRPQNENVKSVVFVPERDELLKVPSYFKVIAYGEANRTVYSLKWRVDDDARAQGVETVTLFWCKKNKYEERCMNKLEWEIVQNPDVNIKNLTYLEEKPLYMFGISVNSRTSSSGIKWITCIASHGNRPPPIDQFEVTTESSKEVLLKWSLDCKAKAAEPIGFNISYCVAPEGSSKCPVDVEKFSEYIDDEAAVQHNVQNLHPYTKYIFNIAVLTQVGLSQWSKSILVKTESDKPSGPPRHLVQKDLGQTWVLLSWSAPDPLERNGEIIKYEVSRLYGGKQVVKYDNSSEFIQHNVTGLDPYTNYTFEVVPCTRGKSTYEPCGSHAAKIEIRTKIGAPLEVDDITQVDDILKWDHECISGPNCSYELVYTVNSTEHRYKTKPYAADVNLRDLNITCTQAEKKIVIKLRAFTHDETGRELYGPEKAQTITCYLPVAWWVIVLIVAIASVIVIIVLVVGRYGWDKIKEFIREWKLKPVLPPGLEDMAPQPLQRSPYYDIWPQISRDSVSHEKQKSPLSPLSDGPDEHECQDLIPPGGERGGRNLSGDSGTSETDPGDSSGCSTGGESDSSSASDRVHQSSDSGTVQEEPGFHMDGSKYGRSGSLRLRTPGTPYVRQGLPDGMTGYVSAGSVPNLAVGMSDGSLSMQPFTPNGALGTLPEMPVVARTSTGYISMPDADADAISLDVLHNLALSHEGRQAGFPTYSRHNNPYKKTVPDISPYTKTGSLPWLNTGYVAVAQAEGGRREATPQARGYVAVSDAMGVMKRQPSLPSLSTGFTKSVSTPDEDLPPGAYCRVGSRSSPGPPAGSSPGYVGITQAIPLHTAANSLTTTSPTNKSPYVTCAIAEDLVSQSSPLEKVTGGYVSVGDMSDGRWAHPVIQPDPSEDSREVASAPVESSRGRPVVPTRPSTSDATVNHNRGGNRWPPLAPSLSKQSSGYVSQETLPFHDPVVMSPKRLLAQSHEPHSVVLSANHKASMV